MGLIGTVAKIVVGAAAGAGLMYQVSHAEPAVLEETVLEAEEVVGGLVDRVMGYLPQESQVEQPTYCTSMTQDAVVQTCAQLMSEYITCTEYRTE
jgi:hypothetical protein